MRRLAFAFLAAIGLIATPALATNIPLFSGSQYSEPSQILATINALVLQINTSLVPITGGAVTCTGTTTSTCTGARVVVSVTGLTTAAAGASSAAMTVTDTAVLSVNSQVLCNVNVYAGTGVPIATTIIPGTGQFSFTITNVAATGALNATVPVACVVYN